jgi:hypothetical protein
LNKKSQKKNKENFEQYKKKSKQLKFEQAAVQEKKIKTMLD